MALLDNTKDKYCLSHTCEGCPFHYEETSVLLEDNYMSTIDHCTLDSNDRALQDLLEIYFQLKREVEDED